MSELHQHTFKLFETRLGEDIICEGCKGRWSRELREECRNCRKLIPAGQFTCDDKCYEEDRINREFDEDYS